MDKELKEIERTVYEQVRNINEEIESLKRKHIAMPKNTKVEIKKLTKGV